MTAVLICSPLQIQLRAACSGIWHGVARLNVPRSTAEIKLNLTPHTRYARINNESDTAIGSAPNEHNPILALF